MYANYAVWGGASGGPEDGFPEGWVAPIEKGHFGREMDRIEQCHQLSPSPPAGLGTPGCGGR